MKTIEDFKKTYQGQQLLKKFTVDTIGIWVVRGEDSNADFGGVHHMPILGYYEGQLFDVINIAVNHKNFWTWGAGGDIELIRVVKVDPNTMKRKGELEQTRESLAEKLAEVESQLKALG